MYLFYPYRNFISHLYISISNIELPIDYVRNIIIGYANCIRNF